jgi:hypothetical protein
LVTCFNRHTYAEICQALGFSSLNYRDGRKSADTTRTIEKVYRYHDEKGSLLYETVRYHPKDFRQRRPDGADGYIWNLDGVRKVLYRLPEILAAINEGMTVFVTEGERDADTLWEYGQPATTCPLGAGKWLPEYSKMLHGADVIICGDNDPPGIRHVSGVAASLKNEAKRVRIMTLPPSVKDISEWFEVDGNLDSFFRMIEEAIDYRPRDMPDDGRVKILRASDYEPVGVSWLWFPRIPLGKLTLLEGDPGQGKSAAALAIATAVTRGKGLPPNPDAPVPQGNVLYLSAEDGLRDTIIPRLISMEADRSRVFLPDRLFSLEDEGLVQLEIFIRQVKPTLVVLDPVMAYLSLEIDIHKANHVRHVLSRLGYLSEKYNTSILAIRHLTKSPTSKGLYRGIGSIDFTAAARSVLLAGVDAETGDRGLVHLKSNLAALADPLGYSLSDDGCGGLKFEWLSSTTVTQEGLLAGDERRTALNDARDFLLDILAEGEVLQSEIETAAEKADIRPRTLRNAKKQLKVQSRHDGKTRAWYWSLPVDITNKNRARMQN